MGVEKLTDGIIKNDLIAKNGKRTDYWDEDEPGLSVRISPPDKKGRVQKTFLVAYRFHGVQRRLTLGTFSDQFTLAKARKKAREAKTLAGLANEARDLAGEKLAKRLADTFQDMSTEYVELYSKPRKRSYKEDERLLKKTLLPEFGNMKLDAITKERIVKLLDTEAKRAPVGANRLLACLRKMLNWAKSRGMLKENPCDGIERLAPEAPRERTYSKEELKSLYTEFGKLREPLGSAFKLQLLTVQRPGEVHSIEWREIDWDNATWTIPAEKTKGKRTHIVPLSSPALKILRDLRARQDKSKERKDNPWVFQAHHQIKEDDSPERRDGGHLGNVQKAKMRLREKTGIADFRPHDLRRTATTMMRSMGVPQFICSRILNHAETGVTGKHYDMYDCLPEKRAALEKWARHLTAITTELKVVPARQA